MNYIFTIGLEIHAELRTKTKMFCDCLNDSSEKHPNINVCPICLGHPGVLPTINKKAIEAIIKLGLALKAEIRKVFSFDRKNYFYPDLPKGYQISQHNQPIVAGGIINNIKINHVHLEEDAGKLVHSTNFADQCGPGADQRGSKNSPRSQQMSAVSASLVDFNRAGVPLMELVTEPDIHSVKDAVAFAKELQLILRYLEISDADFEKGQMRVDVNISLREIADNRGQNADHAEKNSPRSQPVSAKSALGTKVEIKNLNSFRAMEAALNYEIKRQAEVLDSGKEVSQETRGWDEARQITKSQRSKEQVHDYRYFPEPDLPPLSIDAFDVESIKLFIPELPREKRERFQKEYGLDHSQANLLAEERSAAQYFEEIVSEFMEEAPTLAEGEVGVPTPYRSRGVGKENESQAGIKLIFNYLTSDLKGLMKELEISFSDLKITPENFADLIELIAKDEISSRVAKDLLKKMADTGLDPREIVKQEGLQQVSGEEELKAVVQKILAENPNAIIDYKNGKTNALQFLIGKAIAALKGRANPGVLKKLFEESL